MDLLRDTSLETANLFWATEPPKTSMIVVAKATFVLAREGAAKLCVEQDVPTGELHWDDDPARSVRYPSDFALLKPRGECFVTGSVRTLSGRPEERTVAGFRVGPISKSLAVYGDRTWGGARPSTFEAMPLQWERAFGGPSYPANPLGCGLDDGRLPNFELESAPITSREQRPAPAGVGATGMSWPARTALTGTYDERWKSERWPWLPKDFRYAYFNEAPADQQIEGYWHGDEVIALQHLHPIFPRLESRLPRILPRVFVVRGEDPNAREGFEEVRLVCDTITIDADRGLVFCVWRGQVRLDHTQLAPDGLARLFTMHEDLGAEGARGATLDACWQRMRAAADARDAALEALKGDAPPPAAEPPPDDQTFVDAPADDDARARAVEVAARLDATKKAEEASSGPDPLEELTRQLADAGVDVAALTAGHEDQLAAFPKLEPKALREAFEKQGMEAPAELDQLEEELAKALAQADEEPEQPKLPEAPPAPDLREVVVAAHRKGAPLVGDFTGANLAGLDLHGLKATDAILMEANFRGTNLTGAKLDGANLTRADFLSANLGKASLRGADLTEAVLEDAKLLGARLSDATLDRAECQAAVFDEAVLEKASLQHADLRAASFAGARCAEAVFNHAKLDGARFAGAKLVDARFYSVSAPGIFLDGADLSKLRVGRGADLTGASARGVRAVDSNWRDATLKGASMAGTALTHADFTGADLSNAVLTGCSMRRAILQQAVLVGASLRGADVMEGTFQRANLGGTDLRGANLYAANFYEAFGDNASLEGANVDGTMWEKR
ncbi:MAG: DUF2169 domain-containing protein [Sandaracinaceae bacterium]|nr:DUF2169 domain-containing protein [Sandaracinaceae bacterium]